MKKRLSKIFIAFICLTLAFSCLTAQAVTTSESLVEKIDDTANHMLSLDIACAGCEWSVIGLARAEKLPDETASSYYKSIADYVEKLGKAKLSNTKSTENSKVIIALASIGRDAYNVAGFNLLSPLADLDYVKRQGINGAVYALIAFDTFGYEIPNAPKDSTQTTRKNLISTILENELSNGGWALSGNTADVDITGMTIQALAPYYTSNDDVKSAVDKALCVLSSAQLENGGFGSVSEGTAQIITALVSLGIDPATDERFIKNGNLPLDAIMSFSVDNGFAHTLGGTYNQMATEQAFYSLAAYLRMKDGKTSLYDMKDVKYLYYDANCDGVFNIDDCTDIQRYLANLKSFSDKQLLKADGDNDGVVTIFDATKIQKLLANYTN